MRNPIWRRLSVRVTVERPDVSALEQSMVIDLGGAAQIYGVDGVGLPPLFGTFTPPRCRSRETDRRGGLLENASVLQSDSYRVLK
jgi:hypothetical protein